MFDGLRRPGSAEVVIDARVCEFPTLTDFFVKTFYRPCRPSANQQ